MNATMSERRMINLFKTFIQKVFVPFIPKMDSNVQKQWNTFSKMIIGDTFNYGQVQLYVDTLSMPSQGITPNVFDRNRNKSPINIANSRKDSISEGTINMGGFNPSKTFGGQRARIALQMNMQDQNKSGGFGSGGFRQSKQTSFKEQKSGMSTLSLQPVLQRLFKTFSDNQNKLDKIAHNMSSSNNGRAY